MNQPSHVHGIAHRLISSELCAQTRLMRTRPACLYLLLFLLTTKITWAQTIDFGFQAGANYSNISNLSTIILSEPYFIDYKIQETGRYGWHLGIFYEYKLESNKLAFQSEIVYSRQGGNVVFNNTEKDFNYKMQFAYQYINLVGLAKWYPFAGRVSFAAGPFLGINVAPRDIIYTSWGKGVQAAFGTDLEQQQQLRNVLLGRNNFGLAVDIGYNIGSLVKIGARYYWSATNTVETEANSYNFIAAKNTNTVYELSVAINFANFFD